MASDWPGSRCREKGGPNGHLIISISLAAVIGGNSYNEFGGHLSSNILNLAAVVPQMSLVPPRDLEDICLSISLMVELMT